MKIIKLTLFLFFILNSTDLFSQDSKTYVKAKVMYGVKVRLDKQSSRYKIHEKFSPGLNKRKEEVASEIDFTLLFHDTSSLFYEEKKLYSDKRAASAVLTNVGYFGRIKQQESNYITEELEEAFGKFLVSRSYQKWKLEDETKTIGKYLCFKATTFYTVTSPQGKVFKHNFTAWYAPEIPYKYGPAGYGNLPGFIIELQGKDFTYGVKKIEFFDDRQNISLKMPKLKRKKQISEEEFEKLAAEDEKKWRNK